MYNHQRHFLPPIAYLMTTSVLTPMFMIILLDPNLVFMLFHTKPTVRLAVPKLWIARAV